MLSVACVCSPVPVQTVHQRPVSHPHHGLPTAAHRPHRVGEKLHLQVPSSADNGLDSAHRVPCGHHHHQHRRHQRHRRLFHLLRCFPTDPLSLPVPVQGRPKRGMTILVPGLRRDGTSTSEASHRLDIEW